MVPGISFDEFFFPCFSISGMLVRINDNPGCCIVRHINISTLFRGLCGTSVKRTLNPANRIITGRIIEIVLISFYTGFFNVRNNEQM